MKPDAKRSSLGPTAPARGSARVESLSFEWALHWVHPIKRVIPIREGELRIGRDPALECALDDDQVSRCHARITLKGIVCSVADQQSTNGVHVDSRRIDKETNLHDGSVLRTGSHVGVVVHAPNASLPVQPLLTLRDITFLGSAKLAAVIEQAKLLSRRNEAIFVRGESGAGKEMLAELVHAHSGRSGRYVTLNASTARGDLAGAALFGHVRGAFSGAHQASDGAARSAHGGTLFLDEIAELPLDTQPLFLRFLECGEITPVGSSTPERVDVRVVSATHEDLFARCRQGKFREDLYYRLTQHELMLPPLRERREDILSLFESRVRRDSSGFSYGFVETLLAHRFRGNVRELMSVAAKLSALAPNVSEWNSELLKAQLGGASSTPAEPDWHRLHEQFGGIATRMAAASGVPVSTVKRRLQELGLREPKPQKPSSG
jgi:transcriptional regulator of acetoin/glycerol metabolism